MGGGRRQGVRGHRLFVVTQLMREMTRGGSAVYIRSTARRAVAAWLPSGHRARRLHNGTQHNGASATALRD